MVRRVRDAAGPLFMTLGAVMIVGWTAALIRDSVAELYTEGPHFLLVLAAELLAAELLVVAGVGLHNGQRWGDRLAIFAAGMFAYSALNHAGAWIQSGAFVPAIADGLVAGAVIALAAGAKREGPRRGLPSTVDERSAA